MKKLRKKHINEAADPTLGGISYTVQGTPGYVYRILPLTHSLEQKTNKTTDFRYIHSGCTVKGNSFNNPDNSYIGIVQRVVKNEDGSIRLVTAKTVDTNKIVTLDPDSLKLIINDRSPEQTKPQFTMSVSHNMKI